MSERILLCVDVSYQSDRATAMNQQLTSGDTFTGGLYGFLMFFGKVMRETRATHVAFCTDAPPYQRSLEYPQYKHLRKRTQDDDLHRLRMDSRKLVKATLEDIGCALWCVPGFESDDLIAHAVRQYACRFDHIYAASNDSDLYQLLECDSFSIYKTDIKEVVTRKTLLRDLGLTPAQYMLATALQGTHNDIEGIAGVGEKRSRSAVKDAFELRQLRERHAELIQRNLHLIKLPHPHFPSGVRLPQHRPGFKFRQLYRMLGRYDIQTTPSMIDAFEAFMPV